MYQDVSDGTGFGIVVTKKFMEETNVDKIELRSSHNSVNLKDIIETKQYLMGSWLNELGLNANYNMKREAINESEADLNEDSLLPMIDDMLQQRKLMVESINTKFGTNIEVELSSSWKKIREEIKTREEQQESQIDSVSEKVENEQVQNENE